MYLGHVTLRRENLISKQMLIAGSVAILMMLFGILMLLQQGGVIDFGPAAFYKFLTIHGTGMIGAAVLAATAIMWYFLNHYVKLSKTILKANFVLFLVGVVMIIIGTFAFDYSGTWTFLYPLPAISGGAWGTAGAVTYLLGLQLV